MKHHMHRRNHFPFSFFVFSMLFLFFFGWKLFFIVPLFMMFAIFGALLNPYHRYAMQPIVIEKRKRKPKYDDHYDGDYI